MRAYFRLHDAAQYPRWYRQPPPAPELLGKAVFGLPELHAPELPDAALVAVPGCYSTASILALAPAVSAGLAGAGILGGAQAGVGRAGRSVRLRAHLTAGDEMRHAYATEQDQHVP